MTRYDQCVPEIPVSSLFHPDDAVLVVDDDPGVRAIVAWRIRRLGCTVIEAGDADAALGAAASVNWRITVLVTDVAMPGSNGYTLATHLASRCPGVRVLYVTGDMGDHAACLSPALATAVLEKPFDGPTLVQALSQLMMQA